MTGFRIRRALPTVMAIAASGLPAATPARAGYVAPSYATIDANFYHLHNQSNQQAVRVHVGDFISIQVISSSPDAYGCGFWPYGWSSWVSGSVPPGMIAYSDLGLVEGTPTEPGVYGLTGGSGCALFSQSLRFQIVVSELTVDSLEWTQSIQEPQPPVDLYHWLNGDAWPDSVPPFPLRLGDLPVPLVEHKPGLLRVYLKEVSRPTRAKVRVKLRDAVTDEVLDDVARITTLYPGCSPIMQRLHLQSGGRICHSVDFFFSEQEARAGTYKMWVALEDQTYVASSDYYTNVYTLTSGGGEYIGNPIAGLMGDSQGCLPDWEFSYPLECNHCDTEFERQAIWACEFPPFAVNEVQRLVMHPVSVCHRKPGEVDFTCGDPERLPRMSRFFSRVAPVNGLAFAHSTDVLHIQQSADPDGIDKWWDDLALAVQSLQASFPTATEAERHVAFGVIHPDAPGPLTGGISMILSDSASSRSSSIWPYGEQIIDDTSETMAHEMGHALGLDHTGTDQPNTPNPPGCYLTAGVVTAGNSPGVCYWPYGALGNFLFYGDPAHPVTEVGVDVRSSRIVGSHDGDPNQAFELMGYCYPQWVTPWSATSMYQRLMVPTSGTRAAKPAASSTEGQFMLVSGKLGEGGVEFRPIFTIDTSASTDPGEGTHRIEIRDAGGLPVYTRWFTPSMPVIEKAASGTTPMPQFSELVPATAGAASLVVIDDQEAVRGELPLGGAGPVVTITYPTGGELLQGVQNISWTVTGGGSPTYTSWIQYSADLGATWKTLGLSVQASVLPVDFDALPGASGTGLIRVYASDGANTGQANSATFSVPAKLPRAAIDRPANGDHLHVGEVLSLEGSGFTPESGILSGASLEWESPTLGTPLGTGDRVLYGVLDTSLIGTHTITLTATDTVGQQASDTVTFTVDARSEDLPPDQLNRPGNPGDRIS